jgi:hypothetical protein
MKWAVELELRDVYGGDGEVRYEPREKVTLSRTRTKTMVRESIGIAVKVGTEEEIKEKKLEPIATFRFDEERDAPTLRLGGAHGKLWGALKASAKHLYNLGDPDFKKAYKAAMDMITVSPVWVPLEVEGDIRVEGIPQVLKGSGGGMIIQRFDVIPKARVRVTLTFPDALEPKVEKLLQQLEMGSHLNKRRASIRVLKTVED